MKLEADAGVSHSYNLLRDHSPLFPVPSSGPIALPASQQHRSQLQDSTASEEALR
eukprot:IDg16014t1